MLLLLPGWRSLLWSLTDMGVAWEPRAPGRLPSSLQQASPSLAHPKHKLCLTPQPLCISALLAMLMPLQ